MNATQIFLSAYLLLFFAAAHRSNNALWMLGALLSMLSFPFSVAGDASTPATINRLSAWWMPHAHLTLSFLLFASARLRFARVGGVAVGARLAPSRAKPPFSWLRRAFAPKGATQPARPSSLGPASRPAPPAPETVDQANSQTFMGAFALSLLAMHAALLLWALPLRAAAAAGRPFHQLFIFLYYLYGANPVAFAGAQSALAIALWAFREKDGSGREYIPFWALTVAGGVCFLAILAFFRQFH